MQIPGGYKFYLPELKWSAPANYPSFDRVVMELQQVIRANPALAAKHRWPTDKTGVENWVDLYNATVCARMGWDQFLITDTGGSAPKLSAPHQQATLQSLQAAAARAKELVQGAKTIKEWIDSGEPPVDAGLSTHRAIVCSSCPKNEAGDFTKWFTVPAAELIKRQIERVSERKLTTPRDDALNLCTACHCPLKLKVHIPIDWITKRLTVPQITALKEAPQCWIINEMNQSLTKLPDPPAPPATGSISPAGSSAN